MPAGPAHPPLDAQVTLHAALDDALQRPRWHLGFAPALEARLEADTGASRSRSLLLPGLLALLVYDLFLFNDWFSRPAVLGLAAAWRLGVATPIALVLLLLIRRGLPPLWRETAAGGLPVMAMFTACMILQRTPAPAAVYDLFVISLIFTAGNILFRLRFVHALTSSLISVVMALTFALLHPGIPQDALGFALGVLGGSAVFTVMAARQTEAAARQNYLLLLRETLRSEAAQRSASAFAEMSHTDALTQVANRRAFDTALASAWQSARAEGKPLALLLIDIDHFKQFNDHHGHPAGDRCLQQVAAGLAAAVREGDLVARLGGEEFGVLLPRCSLAQAQAAAERLRQAVEQLALPHGGLAAQHGVTVSLGLALAVPQADTDPAHLIDRADAALYQAKRAGRNRWAEAA